MIPVIELKSELEGIIKLEIIKEDGTLKKAEGLNVPFKNLITDAGLNYVSGDYEILDCIAYCRVGTSSTPPTIADTTLGSQTGSESQSRTTANSVQYTTKPYYSNHQVVYTFDVGAVSGNLTEIGFFSAEGTMWSRALIKDSGGNPTTLTLLATEQLKVTYTVRRYIPASITGSFVLNTNGTNSTINYTITPSYISNTQFPWVRGICCGDVFSLIAYETDVLGDITDQPSGSQSSEIKTAPPYVAGSFEKTGYLTIDTTTGNFATGIGSITFFSSGCSYYHGYQCSFSPKIMKTSSQTLTIGIKISWGRTTQQ